MDKVDSVLILVAGLALIPYVADLLGSSAAYIAGLALTIEGIKRLLGK